MTTLLPDNILRCMDVVDRQALGKAGRTLAEVAEAASFSLEKELHAQFSSWLARTEALDWDHNDMSRRSTSRKGMPDFRVFRDSKILFIEFKIGDNQLSVDQKEMIGRLLSHGNTVKVLHSYQAAVDATREFFSL